MDGALKFVQTCATISQGTRQALGKSWQLDPDKPWFHVMPRDGWLNDPNGPIFYKGRYHMCACCVLLVLPCHVCAGSLGLRRADLSQSGKGVLAASCTLLKQRARPFFM
jgi:hypothetical protein